ncbi:MAG: hypothetical protein LBR57_00690 [Alistipes sp.]|jgi:hypothetical protein|nr:hypothetical protein [Alistipes sp.]
MKKIIASTILLAAAIFTQHASAQFMPVVFDNNYGRDNQFTTAAGDFQSGDIVVAGTNGGNVILTWLDREGATRFSTRFAPTDMSEVTSVAVVDEQHVLVTGRRTLRAREQNPATGCAMVIDNTGRVRRQVSVGSGGAIVTSGRVMPNGNMFLAGSTTGTDGLHGMLCKVTPADKVEYTYAAATGEVCSDFNVHGSRTEYVNAAFTSTNGRGSSVIRLDETGKPFFITVMPDPAFVIEKMVAGYENDLFLVGQGPQGGGQVVKLRNEGDIVFQRQIIPASQFARLAHLILCPDGELLVGGGDASGAYFSLLRNDGTVLSTNMGEGTVSAMTVNPSGGDCFVSTHSSANGKGRIVKMSRQGYRLYDKVTAANYNTMFINSSGDLLMGSPSTGRLSMLSPLGELLFDRYVVENTPTTFAEVYLPSTGEAVFLGTESRVAKLAHGVYVSDIVVNEPVDGHVSAIFTVTVSGYSFTNEGSPLPVSVNYETRPVSAVEGVNFNPVSGTISFVPSADGSDRYLNKFTVEVPVNANALLEGARTFTLDLTDVRHSYLIKSSSLAVIEDQPAIVKQIEVIPGVEGAQDVVFKLGIFKRDDTPLINKTNTDIVVDGIYGVGTVDRLDYNGGRMPRLVIAADSHSGTFNVETLEDTRYESVKSVVLNWGTIHAMSDTNVTFGASHISCSGDIYDQAAIVKIESLGDHIRRTNDVVNGLFKISLVNAKTGELLTNHSGADIVLTTTIDDGSSAVAGTDFVITNAHSLRIAGDGRSSTVNLNGLVLHSSDAASKTVSVSLRDVKAGDTAGTITVDANSNKALFTIHNN